MKKFNIIIVFIALALILPKLSLAAFDKNLEYGSQGNAVMELQEFLTDQKIYTGPITGNFYSLTLAAVKAFQAKEGIMPVSGYFGQLSRSKANAMLSADLSVSNSVKIIETKPAEPVQKIETEAEKKKREADAKIIYKENGKPNPVISDSINSCTGVCTGPWRITTHP